MMVGGLAMPLAVLLAGCSNQNDSPATTATPVSATAPAAGDATGTAANADNSANNQRDRNGATLTPDDQGNSQADLEITRKIRQALMRSTNNFSMTAKNVKIITVNGKVALRGPVNTDTEKTGIADIAKNIAGAGNVENQLEIKTNP